MRKHAYILIYARTYECTFVCDDVHVCVYARAHTYKYTHNTYTYVNTHIHTQKRRRCAVPRTREHYNLLSGWRTLRSTIESNNGETGLRKCRGWKLKRETPEEGEVLREGECASRPSDEKDRAPLKNARFNRRKRAVR